MKKALSVMLAVLLLVGLAGCKPAGQSSGEGGGLKDADIWSAPATEKVLRDVDSGHTPSRGEARIDVTAAAGEYESRHLIVTAKTKRLTYDLTTAKLTAADGTVFPAENVDVFHEKYVKVTANYENNGMPTGWYPDALVPLDAIKKAGENFVEPGENQGVYVRFNVPAAQKPGAYTGNFRLTVGGEGMDIPVTLTVADVVVSQTSHAKSIFLNQWSFEKGELDTSQDMLDKYTEALFEYRLNPDIIVTDTTHSDADIVYYTELAYEFMQNPLCTNITIPYKSVSVDDERCIDPVTFDKYLTAFAQKSFETGFNMLEKSVCYIGIIDEPQQNNLLSRVKVVTRVYREQLTATADRLAADESIQAKNKDAVIASMRKVRNVVTCAYASDYAAYVDTWCPLFNYYDSETSRAKYDAQEEKWWYGCISPRAPYPTYHTEDTLLSARAVGWMQADYDIVGNLFWATDIYAAYNGAKYEEIDEYYTGNASRFPNVNGDGYLFYPGKQYGIDGPVGSLRLEAIRDGLEEYELLYAMKQKYAAISQAVAQSDPAKGFTADTMIESLSGLVYNGAKVATTNEKFQSARDALLQLAVLNESEADFCVTDYRDDGYGVKTYVFYAAEGAAVKNNGQPVTDARPAGDGKLYTVVTNLTAESNVLDITVETNGKTYAYRQELGGKVSVNRADVAKAEDFTREGVSPAFTLADAPTVDPSLTGKLAKIDLPAAASGTAQSFRVQGGLLGGLDKTADKLIVHIYYGGTDNPAFVISAKHKNQRTYVDMANVTLKKGMNEITISLAAKSWDKLGEVEYLALYFGGKTGEPARSAYLMDTVVYGK